MGIYVTSQDRFLLSQGILDEEWHVLNHPAGQTDIFVSSASRYDSPATWSATTWLAIPWEGAAYLVDGQITTSS